MLERFNAVVRNTEEVVTRKELRSLLENKKHFNFYYGTAPTGPFHLGYLIPLGKIVDCMKSGGNAVILIADYHAYLDDKKTPWEEMEIRSRYYQKCIELILREDAKEITFIKGSGYQTESAYTQDLLKTAALVTTVRARRAASEVTRMKNPKVSELIYPIMQSLDVKYLESDIVMGGIDQRHIYMLSREILPQVGYEKPICVFTPLIMSLKGPGVKMSASEPGTHLRVHESEEDLKKLIQGAYCPPTEPSNPITEICRLIILPLMDKITIDRSEKYGGYKEYDDSRVLVKDYLAGDLHPADLKEGVFEALRKLFKPVRDYFDSHPDFMEAVRRTYGW